MPSKWLQRSAAFLDKQGLFLASFFLLIFIPLYPKLPLFDAIPGYLVRVRVEDILVLVTGLWWLVQLYRRQITWRIPLLGMIVTYAGIGSLSVLSGVFLLQTIPLELLHIGKSGLHFIRYLEYFSVFFFMFSAVTSVKQAKVAVWLLSLTVVVATIYGAGQKYASWPVYSTMNREFSKGAQLSLTEFARVPSTFGGHYDLAAFLVIVLPVLLAVSLAHPRNAVKVCLGGVMALGCWLLFASGSKTAFLALAVGMYLSFLLSVRRSQWLFRGALGGTIAALVVFLGVGGYFWTHPQDTRLVTTLHGWGSSPLVRQVSPLAQLVTKAEIFFQNHQSGEQRPYDLVIDETKDFTWSENAIKYGLSMGIRLDTLWPQALRGLARSLYLGSGYGTLNKTANSIFVEADSTDNNFLRTLGETGLLGFAVFYGVIILALRLAAISLNHKDWWVRSLSIGLIAATVGLLCNALIIDVFVASKVAFTYWALVGIVLKINYVTHPKVLSQRDKARAQAVVRLWNQYWALGLGLGLLLFLLHHNPLVSTSHVLNLTADPDRTQALTTIRCWLDDRQWQLCRPGSSIPSTTSYVYGGYLLVFYSIWQSLGTFYYANLILAFISLWLLYRLAQTVLKNNYWVAGVLAVESIALFLASVVALPVDVNISLTLSLATAGAGWAWYQQRSPKWLVTMVGLGILNLSTWPSLQLSDWVVVIFPFGLLGLVKLIKDTHISVSLETIYSKVGFSVLVSGLCLSLWWLQDSRAVYHLLEEYQGAAPAWRLQAVKAANDYFSSFAARPGGAARVQPRLLTTTNPFFYDFRSNGQYQLLPLAGGQAFTEQVSQIWGDFDYTSTSTLARDVLKQKIPLFISEYDLTPTVGQPEFKELESQHNLDLVAFGCEENCNLYQLSDEPPAYESSLPFNRKPLVFKPETAYSFIVYSHRFNHIDPQRNHTLLQSIAQLKPVTALQPNLMVMTGDVTKDNDADQLALFMQQVGNQVQFPLYYLPGNYDEVPQKPLLAGYQQVVAPHSLILLVDPDPEGRIGDQQRMALYNAVIDLPKHPEITSVFIISHRLTWLGNSQGYESLVQATHQPKLTEFDSFIQDKLLPKLKQLPGKEVYFISGDLKPQAEKTFFYERDLNGFNYLAAAVNNDPSDVYLKINVDAQGLVQVVPMLPTGVSLEKPEDFGVTYWKTFTPGLHPQHLGRHPVPPWFDWAWKILVSGGVGVPVVVLATLVRRLKLFKVLNRQR
jgi:hypothetical protein